MNRLVVKLFSLVCFVFRTVFDTVRYCYARKHLIWTVLRPEPCLGQPRPKTYPHPFTEPDTVPFGWLLSVSPCFPIDSQNVTILSKPREFYTVVKEGCASAAKRVALVSLYWGTGELEKDLVATLLGNENLKNGNLTVDIVLDYARGSRSGGRTVLEPLLRIPNCHISMYRRSALSGWIPEKWNELFGVQHMKLYIFDDVLVISGANLSNYYFTNRQDRYFVVRDRDLCDFYLGFLGILQSGASVQTYISEAVASRNERLSTADTWIFPLFQMASFGITQDSDTTTRLIAQAPRNSSIYISTGYFNLTPEYKSTLINRTEAQTKILLAHPQANSFWGDGGVAGNIPYAYSLIARQFQTEIGNCGRFSLLEYLRSGWTFHGKGLWYYPPHQEYPSLTLIGSSNFGERSVKRDLEAQILLVTENRGLRRRLHEECQGLYGWGEEAGVDREVPAWVHAFVFLFRDFY